MSTTARPRRERRAGAVRTTRRAAPARALRSAGQVRPERAASWAFAVLGLATVALLTVIGGARLWFFGDEWAFIVGRRELWATQQYAEFLFAPHNEHWVTLPVLAYAAIFDLVGLAHYWPYVLAVAAVHGLACGLLRALLRSCGLGPWAATGLASVLLVLGSGAENLTWAFQVSFVGSVALGLAQVLVTAGGGARPSRRDLVAAWAGLGAVMCSGMGVPYVAAAGLSLGARRLWGRAAVAVGVPALALLAWWALAGRGGGGGTGAVLTSVAPFLWQGLAHTTEQAFGLMGAGAALVVVVAASIARAAGSRRPGWHLSLAAGGGAAVLFLLVSMGRAGAGPGGAAASRYVYTAAPLVLLAAVPALRWLGDALPSGGGRALGFVLLVVWASVSNLSAFGRFLESREVVVGTSTERILAAASLDLDEADPAARPEPQYTPDLHVAALRGLLAGGHLDRTDATAPSARAAAAARVLVTTGTSIRDAEPVEVGAGAAPEDGCHRPTASTLELSGPAGSGFELHATAAAAAELLVEVEGVLSPPVELVARPGEPAAVRLGGQLDLVLRSGSPQALRLCPPPG